MVCVDLSSFVPDLKSKNEDVRNKAARDLYHYVSSELREVPTEKLNAMLDDFNTPIIEMMISVESSSKLGGLLAIIALINSDVCNSGMRIHRFVNYVINNCLPGNTSVTDPAVIQLATKAIGRLTQLYGTYKANLRCDFINSLIKTSFEWITLRSNELKCYGAVLILREIAVCEPTFFFQNVPQFFDVIFIPISDSKPYLREASVNALRAGLIVTAQRETTKQSIYQYEFWYNQCYNSVISSFENSKENVIIGGLAVLAELLRTANVKWEGSISKLQDSLTPKTEMGGETRFKNSSTPIPFTWFGSVVFGQEILAESAICKNLLLTQFDILCTNVLSIANNYGVRNPSINSAIVLLFPKLAALQTELYVQKYLNSTVAYLDKLLSLKEFRYEALIAMGTFAVSIGLPIKDHLSNVLDIMRNFLPPSPSFSSKDPNPSTSSSSSSGTLKKRSNALDPAIFACIAMLACAVKESIKSDIMSMMDSIFSVGLSPALNVALHNLANYIPSLKKEIADGLLRILSFILMQMPFRHPGAPLSISSSEAFVSPSSSSIILGLQTLGTFDFKSHSLLQFIHHCADSYLYSENKDIRLQAVKTVSALLKETLGDLNDAKAAPTVMATINDVLAKLLTVGITDTDPDVRTCVMNYLDERFDFHLAQAENLSALFVALNDEIFEIRELTMCIIGRLSILNPAYIMPSLRVSLIQLLTEMEYSGLGRNKEQAAIILGHLVSNAPKLIRPYVEPILKVLIPKLKENDLDPLVHGCILRCIGDLAHVGGSLMKNYEEELLPLLIEMLNDSSSTQKRERSLWVLSKLIESTGSVLIPYNRYPFLLDMLLTFLKIDQRAPIRRQTLRLLGLLGALDPYRFKMNMGIIDSAVVQSSAPLIPINDSELESSIELTPSEMFVNMGTGNLEEFYPSVAICSLMKIIREPTAQHNDVVKAVTFIFNALGSKSIPYIPQVIPSLIYVIRSSDTARCDFLFLQLGYLVTIVRQHIRDYLQDIFNLIKEFWVAENPLQFTIISLIENICTALGSEFKIYLPQLIPNILRILIQDSSEKVTLKLLLALQEFGNTLDDYIHLILPPIVKLFDSSDKSLSVRKGALECIDVLSDSLDFSDFASRIIHPLARVLGSSSELNSIAMDTLTSIARQLGPKYSIFSPMIHKILLTTKIVHQRYEALSLRLKDSTFLEDPSLSIRLRSNALKSTSHQGSDIKSMKLHFGADSLQRAWVVNRRVSKDDWLEWHSKLCIELLKASPSHALRACSSVAQRCAQLGKDLFNTSFVSCWFELDAVQQDELMDSLEQALTFPDLPEISQTILNLAEFMEHCDKGRLPLDPNLLGNQAMRCRAYAKALHYKEEEFLSAPSVPTLESLISINNKLGQKEAASGLLEWGRKNLQGNLKVQERWYEKLHNWERALQEYRTKGLEDPNDPELLLGKMRCLEALSEWGELHELSKEKWESSSEAFKGQMAQMATTASWGQSDWDSMSRFVAFLPKGTQDGGFYRAVLEIHRENWSSAQRFIDRTRELLDREVTALSSESYQRVYPTMICVQMLRELEEVIEYKVVPERRSTIVEMWWDRLQGCQRVVEDWQRILQVRSLVLKPVDDARSWLKFASLCRRSNRLPLSHKTLLTLLGVSEFSSSFESNEHNHNIDLFVSKNLPLHLPQASFAYCKHLYASDQKRLAFETLKAFVKDSSSSSQYSDNTRLLSRAYLKLGQWLENLEGLTQNSIGSILEYLALSTKCDRECYKAWHHWALSNFQTVLFYKENETIGPSPTIISTYGVPALKGFVRSIALSKGSSLQDTLRLLTLLFDYGYYVDMHEALHEGIRTIEIDTWLQVLPQLIARIDTPRPLVSRLIAQLLMDIGKHHPQALVYSLTVACKSNNPARKEAANKILNKMKEHSERLVNDALMTSDELIRVAILWHELWHEGLEEASRLYFGEKNIPAMLAVLEPLHALLEKGPQTLKETSFVQTYGQDLKEAKNWCLQYESSKKSRDLNQAWEIYYQVFRRISRQLPQLTQLELQYVSPKLLRCRDLELAVPGSYDPNSEVIRISHVLPSLQIITSKQRPRKLSIRGSNGRTYMFLLKGHEDLRQDERVMQFFSLVNSLLFIEPVTYRRNLAIQRFAVIPLSTNSGLIGWVPHSDTLHGLIKDYREKKRVLLNIEHRIMQRMTPDYDHLPLINKVEVFEHSLESTEGDDLAKLLMLKSPSSEVWFERRTNFTRSLAVMSMVGYILGLGDRHPSNLLLDRLSGKILHIDFGDCFEVAMTRDKFPEKIPFRLTRMLINAMEVTGIEGTYRQTCESVLTVLRRNKDSLMAILEAFVYDPLLNWRLTTTITTLPNPSPPTPITSSSTLITKNIALLVSSSSSTSTTTKLKHKSEVEQEPISSKLENPLNPPRIFSSENPLVEPEIDNEVIKPTEVLNKKALEIIKRVRDKLTGKDFHAHPESLDVSEQVDLLIRQATSNENLCQCYIGWCPFW